MVNAEHEEFWVCGACGTSYGTEQEAEECCMASEGIAYEEEK